VSEKARGARRSEPFGVGGKRICPRRGRAEKRYAYLYDNGIGDELGKGFINMRSEEQKRCLEHTEN